jgi:hypothetical protein
MKLNKIARKDTEDLSIQVESLLTATIEADAYSEYSDLEPEQNASETAGVIKGVANFLEEMEFSASKYLGEVEGESGQEGMHKGEIDPVFAIRKEMTIARAALNRASEMLGVRVEKRQTVAERF